MKIKSPPPTKWAAVYTTVKFIYVEARSGYSRNLADAAAYENHLAPDSTDLAVARAVLDALKKSRQIDPDRNRKFFEGVTISENYKAWIADLMGRYGFKSKAQLFGGMNYVWIAQKNGKMTFLPHRRDKPEYWYDLDDQAVVIALTTDANAISDALKLALSRCC